MINVETENPNAIVTVQKVDEFVNTNNVKRLATMSEELELTNGNNYFIVTVVSENWEVEKGYKIKIYVGSYMTKYDPLSIGEAVTAKDGSKWHVLEQSNEGNEYVTLLSDYNLKIDRTYNKECGMDINSTYRCGLIPFDSDNTNTYDESDSNNVGYFVKNTYAPKVLAALPGTTKVTIPTAEQIAIADGKTFNQDALSLTNSWLMTTNYWTQNGNSTTTDIAWGVSGEYRKIYGFLAHIQSRVRPTITTLKSNLLAP